MSNGGISTTLATLKTRRISDEACLTSSLAGDPIAFSEFYRRYHARIRGFLLAKLMDPHAAEDATQEVFLRVLRTGEADIRDARAWLFTVATNVAADIARRRSTRPAETELATDSPAGLPTGRDSASEILDRETARSVFTALRRLVPRQRTALILRELHGQSSADIAEALDTTVGNADVLVSRARDAFGIAYAEVSSLPHACREAVTTIYREMGTGITSSETASLRAHTDACPRCAAEYRRAHSKRYLPSLLPFLVPDVAKSDLIARASVWLRSMPEAVFVHIGSANPIAWSTPAKLAAAGIALTITLAPAVGAVRATAASSTPVSPSVPLVAAREPTTKIADHQAASAPADRHTDSHQTAVLHATHTSQVVKLPDASCTDGTVDTHTSIGMQTDVHAPASSSSADPCATDCTSAQTPTTHTSGDGEHLPGTPRQ